MTNCVKILVNLLLKLFIVSLMMVLIACTHTRCLWPNLSLVARGQINWLFYCTCMFGLLLADHRLVHCIYGCLTCEQLTVLISVQLLKISVMFACCAQPLLALNCLRLCLRVKSEKSDLWCLPGFQELEAEFMTFTTWLLT